MLVFHLLLPLYIPFEVTVVKKKLMGMIEGFLIVTFLKCNNPLVDKNQQTPIQYLIFK